MKTLISLCSEDVIRDAETNSISIFNIIEVFNVENIPFVIAKLSIFYLFQKEDGDDDSIKTNLIIKIGQKELQRFHTPINFQGKERTRNTIKISGLPITYPGSLNIELEGIENTSISIPINIRNDKLDVKVKND